MSLWECYLPLEACASPLQKVTEGQCSDHIRRDATSEGHVENPLDHDEQITFHELVLSSLQSDPYRDGAYVRERGDIEAI